ncbi:hypothetical protein FA13DRAFT_98887 [Coprinellus micaceus]|uniref:Uncharacterized protein n=1 Tax=Coprinellus micaceus TaxID=71717 RepID=A0A4Y7SI40_COPMI|nr:hypothetical protein FA13DRAFT_98887 [Coprinellus micaceus]
MPTSSTYQTEYGQLVDFITVPDDAVDLGKFSLERFTLDKGVVTSKEDPYSVALGILTPLWQYFQVQDDFLDSAPPKVGTDIVDNKCSWVVNTALNLTSLSFPTP